MNPGDKVLVFNGHNLPIIGRLVGYVNPSDVMSQLIVQLGMAEKTFWLIDVYPDTDSGKKQIVERLKKHAEAIGFTIKQMEAAL